MPTVNEIRYAELPIHHTKTFTITPNGDPHGRGWNVTEEIGGAGPWFRGDISPMPYGKRTVVRLLKKWYPGCRVVVGN